MVFGVEKWWKYVYKRGIECNLSVDNFCNGKIFLKLINLIYSDFKLFNSL